MENDNFETISTDKEDGWIDGKIAAKLVMVIILLVLTILGGFFYSSFLNVEKVETLTQTKNQEITKTKRGYDLAVDALQGGENVILYKLNYAKFFDKRLNKDNDFIEFYFTTDNGGKMVEFDRISENIQMKNYKVNSYLDNEAIPINVVEFGIEGALNLVYDDPDYKKYLENFSSSDGAKQSGEIKYDEESKKWGWYVGFKRFKQNNDPAMIGFMIYPDNKSVKNVFSFDTFVPSDGAFYVVDKNIVSEKCLTLFDFVKENSSRLTLQCREGDNFGTIDFLEYKNALDRFSFSEIIEKKKSIYEKNGSCKIANLREFEHDGMPGVVFDCGNRMFLEYNHAKNMFTIEAHQMEYFGMNQGKLIEMLKTFK